MQAIIPLSDLRLGDQAWAGGKAANLGELIAGGFPVPAGFCILTPVYWDFIHYNHLQDAILSLIKTVDLANPGSVESASQAIRALFERSAPRLELADDILEAYHGLGELLPVAVRSSATAEDLPDLSFAGQQDTFLNVVGEEQLLQAVKQAWNSLWTARAMAYRLKNNVPHDDLALAVVVQLMVQSETSGVLFTANPLTGRRGETVINAVFGLGEALVSGQVDPDQYVVNSTGELVSRSLGKKDYVTRGQPEGGVLGNIENWGQEQALADPVIIELAALGRRLETHFQAPQDAEWARAGEKLFLVQSRPITSLYPLVEGLPVEPLSALGSFGALQGMLEPMTPSGRDIIKSYVAGISPLFGRRYSIDSQPLFFTAGERLFANISPLLRNRIGRKLVQGVLGAIEPGTLPAIRAVLSEPVFSPGRHIISASALFRIARIFLPVAARIPKNLIAPDTARQKARHEMNKLLGEVSRRSSLAQTLADKISILDYFMVALPRLMIYHIIPRFGPAVGLLNLLNHLAAGLPGGQSLGLEITRGLPHNVTTEMDLELWKTAYAIQGDEASARLFSAWEAKALAAAFTNGQLPLKAQSALADFINRYGFRGLAEIDLGRARWKEDPSPLIQALQSYLEIRDPAQAPDEVFRRGAARAQEAIEELVRGLRNQKSGWMKAHLARFAASRVRALIGLRELPKFVAVQVMGIYREALLASAARMIPVKLLNHPDDIFFLHYSEMRELAALQNSDASWPENIAETPLAVELIQKIEQRRKQFAREASRRQVPRLLLTDGRAFYSGVTETGTAQSLQGDPVSPGMVEGIVRVVFDPRRAELKPGEILVCPGTDPSWTPLFLSAGGLVMEVGGLMTHGSVVAREYGIPAVVGVSQATARLKTGQKIRLNGSTGRIEVI